MLNKKKKKKKNRVHRLAYFKIAPFSLPLLEAYVDFSVRYFLWEPGAAPGSKYHNIAWGLCTLEIFNS